MGEKEEELRRKVEALSTRLMRAIVANYMSVEEESWKKRVEELAKAKNDPVK
jgi:hypothetical protein